VNQAMLQNNKPVPLKNVRINDEFWTKYVRLVQEVVIPYQWEALNDRIPDADPSYAIRNFRIAAGKEEGTFGGMVFQDSDLAKWLEAVGYSLTTHPNPELEKLADEAIDLIAAAQHDDGYVNTYFTIKEPDKRWTNLTDCHELYCAGHMMEASVAYYQATGKRKLLDVMCRFADYIDSVFGEEEGKLRGYDGHQEIELALVKLYEATGEEKYVRLSQYFIDERGRDPKFFHAEWEKRGKTSHWVRGTVPAPDLKYHQSHLPVREQSEAVGHSVRAVYMYTAMADLAAHTGDQSLYEACQKLWNNMIHKQMYITGGIGSTVHGEAFTFDYDLPNDIVYAETCASIGLIFFAHRMLQIEAKGEYADVLERALYNNVIGGMSLDGKHYFYVNPLEVWPEASEKNPTRRHVKATRQRWFGCSCCPPNVARLMASLGQYIYTSNNKAVYVNLYMGGEAAVEVGKTNVSIVQQTNYPWNGKVRLSLAPADAHEFTLGLRIPGWCSNPKLTINGEELSLQPLIVDGYALIRRTWREDDVVELELPMAIQRIQSHPQLRANAGKIAIQRGPLVYCLEEKDNGRPISSMSLPDDSKLTDREDKELLGGITVIEGEALCDDPVSWGRELYRPAQDQVKPIPITAVPYYAWGNRGTGEMSVWIRRR
jgi:DUF1680 family protein